uniref:Uncharacterized protein n=1 Tax=Parastrongyloides trichosuri TaxID=131310 RepID=A0A0N4ZDL4_PARTI
MHCSSFPSSLGFVVVFCGTGAFVVGLTGGFRVDFGVGFGGFGLAVGFFLVVVFFGRGFFVVGFFGGGFFVVDFFGGGFLLGGAFWIPSIELFFSSECNSRITTGVVVF